MKTIINVIAIAGLLTAMQACTKNEMEDMDTTSERQNDGAIKKFVVANEDVQHLATMNVYYNKEAYNLRYRAFTGAAAKELIAQTPAVNTMYVYEEGLVSATGKPLANIANAISPFNSKEVVWKEIIIKVNRADTPRQFHSERELLSAVRTSAGMVQLIAGETVYQGNLFEFEMKIDAGAEEQ